ncbi:MAG TPA: hypothetical protein VMV56_07695 [Williamwhitmania sp.]|nr:hypothetical protein [Williamwhitmania sp.]
MKVNEKLDSMVGHSFMHDTRIYKILSYDLNGQLTIVTDKKWFRFPLEKAESVLKQFLPVEDEIEITSLQIVPKGSEMLNLKAVILDNIKKVQSDKGYIKQAESINKSIGQLVNVARLEITFAKLRNNNK